MGGWVVGRHRYCEYLVRTDSLHSFRNNRAGSAKISQEAFVPVVKIREFKTYPFQTWVT